MPISIALLIFSIFSGSGIGQQTDVDESRILLFILYPTADQICSPEMLLFNFTHSVATAVRYVRSLITETIGFFHTQYEQRKVPGCSMMEDNRAKALVKLLEEAQVICAIHFCS